MAVKSTAVGFCGDGIRGDCKVILEPSNKPQVRITSTVEAMFGRAIRQQVADVLSKFGDPPVSLTLEDSGALPWVIEARLEAALCISLGQELPPLASKSPARKRNKKRRTRLYVPGNTPKFMPHLGLFGASSVILDLEDSVPEREKQAALSIVRHAIASLDFGQSEICVRVNNSEEAKAVSRAGAECILVPKVESAEQIKHMADAIQSVQSDAVMIAILESALGVHRAYEIATASERMVAISLGIEDYLTDIQAIRTDTMWETMFAHGTVVNAARAAGISPLSSVYSHVDNLEGMREFAAWSRSMGFDGVGCLHPSQIGPAMAAMAPPDDAIEEATMIVREFEKAQTQGLGAISVRGKMVDAPIYQRAKDLLAEVN